MKRLILLYFILGMVQSLVAQGLRFHGQEKPIAERSSYNVFGNIDTPVCRDSLTIRFDMSVQNVDSPGSVFILQDADSRDAMSLFAVRKDESYDLILSEVGRRGLHTFSLPITDIRRSTIPVSFTLTPGRPSVTLAVGDDSVHIDRPSIFGTGLRPEIYFGMTNQIVEIPSFKLRSLSVTVDSKEYIFPLTESRGTIVHDSDGNAVGTVSDPVWLINDAYYWEPVFERHFPGPGGVSYSSITQDLTVFTNDSVLTCNLIDGDIRTLPMRSQRPTPDGVRLGMNVPDITADGRSILVYEIYNEDSYAAILNPLDGTLSPASIYGRRHMIRHHHTMMHRPDMCSIVLFGGYGDRQYYNRFHTYDYRNGQWDDLTLSGDTIAPRFFSASAVTPDGKGAYIFGGKGNTVGNQDIGVTYFYDLYYIDFTSGSVKRLFSIDTPAENFVPARSMIHDGRDRLYMLIYPEYAPKSRLQLAALDIGSHTLTMLGDTIPMTSEEIATNANLYLDPVLDKLICTIQEFEKEGDFNLTVYTLDFPPVSFDSLSMPETTGNRTSGSRHLLWILSLLVIIPIIMRLRKHKTTPATCASTPPTENDITPCDINGTSLPDYYRTPPARLVTPPDSMLLFGTFKVTDRTGRDITYMFSPTLSKLFIYLLINSVNGRGVLSADLNGIFWPDKSDDKIKNIKNVTINKLRKILQDLDGVSLVYDKGNFRIDIDGPCSCDYLIFNDLTAAMTRPPMTDADRDTVIAILERGKFLATSTEGLFDPYRQAVDEAALKILQTMVSNAVESNNPKHIMRLCDIALNIDPLSEEILALSVTTLCRTGQEDTARRLYTSFAREFRTVMGTPYATTFETLRDSR